MWRHKIAPSGLTQNESDLAGPTPGHRPPGGSKNHCMSHGSGTIRAQSLRFQRVSGRCQHARPTMWCLRGARSSQNCRACWPSTVRCTPPFEHQSRNALNVAYISWTKSDMTQLYFRTLLILFLSPLLPGVRAGSGLSYS